MRVAITHDWLNGMRGGERVLEGLLELYPEATIFTLFHEPGKVSAFIESHEIVPSWLNRIPGAKRHYRNLLPLFPSAVESWDLSAFDLVISSSHAAAKGVRSEGGMHVCYCHTPMRYIWDAEADYAFRFHQRIALRMIKERIRVWDRNTAQRVDHFIANSNFVRRRIAEFYGREAEVIHPPVDTEFFTPPAFDRREDFYLTAGALVAYKRCDLIVEAFNRIERPLVIAGSGPELKRIRRMAGGNIRVLGRITDVELRSLYRRAKGFVFAAREDFGIVAAEAQACGCPVIAYGAGGSLETVQDGISGILFAEQRAEDVIRAIRRFESMSLPVEQVRHSVEGFSREAFKTRIRAFITDRWETKPERHNIALQPA